MVNFNKTSILIYIFNLDNKVYILSLESKEESTYIKEYILGKHKLENYVNGFIEKKDRITELIKYINNNKKINIGNKTYTLQNSLIKADVIIIKIGDEELKYINNYNDIDEYLSDLRLILCPNCPISLLPKAYKEIKED